MSICWHRQHANGIMLRSSLDIRREAGRRRLNLVDFLHGRSSYAFPLPAAWERKQSKVALQQDASAELLMSEGMGIDAQPKRQFRTSMGEPSRSEFPFSFRQCAGCKQIRRPRGPVSWSPTPRVDHSLLKAVIRAHRGAKCWGPANTRLQQKLPRRRRSTTPTSVASYGLTLLAPDIIEAIAMAQQPLALQLDDLCSRDRQRSGRARRSG
jgi:hypothetical protein